MSQPICEANHQEELNALRDRIAELERENAALRSKTLVEELNGSSALTAWNLLGSSNHPTNNELVS